MTQWLSLFVLNAFASGLSTADGLPTHAVYGSLLFLINLIEKEKPDYLVIASDSSEPTFRHEIYEAYKANRSDMPEDLAKQIPYIFQAFSAIQAKTLVQPGVEADDLIGSIATQITDPDLEVLIVSGDKDFMQLINNQVKMYSPKKGGVVKLVDEAAVQEKFGVKPSQVIDVLALIGDSADNVPGVPGIGEKGAAKLIQAHGSLEGIYDNLEGITNKRQLNGLRDNRDQALLSRRLVTIKLDCPLDFELADLACDWQKAIGNDQLLTLAEQLEFKTLSDRIRELA
ncbi:MAG: 5'-3' exonuclease H3TH domain-containing protein, partial [Bacteroidota bacterium]